MPSKDACCYVFLQNFARRGLDFEKVKGVFKMVVGKLTGCRVLL